MDQHIAALEQAGIRVNDALKRQEDDDTLRREHILYWTGLIEDYEERVGRYPFVGEEGSKFANRVLVATPEQERLRTEDNRTDTRFNDIEFADFVAELERGLDRQILPKFDPATDSTQAPMHYSYYSSADEDYVFIVTCKSCGATEISTLLMFEPNLPTLNIASKSMVPKVTKARTRDSMMSHNLWKTWDSYGFHDEAAARLRERTMIEEAGFGDRLPPAPR